MRHFWGEKVRINLCVPHMFGPQEMPVWVLFFFIVALKKARGSTNTLNSFENKSFKRWIFWLAVPVASVQ